MRGQPFPVEAGHILMFARAIGDENPTYLGESALAPPTFTMASAHHDPDYLLRPKQGEEWFGSGAGAGVMPEGGGGLHAEQHFEYHRPVRAGRPCTPPPSPDAAGRSRAAPADCCSASASPSTGTPTANRSSVPAPWPSCPKAQRPGRTPDEPERRRRQGR